MYKKHLLSSLVLLLAILSAAPSVIYAKDVDSAIAANNQFAFELYSKYKSDDGNIFFSPYSISSALAMTYEGAKGKTAEEMQAVFHFPKDDAIRRKSFLEINNQINKPGKKYQLRVANALWAQNNYHFLEDYFKLIEQYYAGKVTNLDFAQKTEESRLTINSWVEKQTNDKIKNLIPPGSLDSMTRLVLTNAIYFKGTWFKRFDKAETRERDFRVTPSNMIKVPMMYQRGGAERFNYAETDTLQILELPYDGEELSMFILLPKDDDLKTMESSLDVQKLSELKMLFKSEEVDVFMPKFKFDAKYLMADDLAAMGMPTAFSTGADFSGMTGEKNLYISQVIHQAFVDVNEEGTEAVAATAVVAKPSCAKMEPPQKKIFKADHPFVFIIQEKETGNILFLGRVSNPKS